MKSQLFYKKAKKIIQESQLDEDRRLAQMRNLFLDILGSSYHRASAQDLFDWELGFIWERKENLYSLLDRLQKILEFLNNEREDTAFYKEEEQLLLNLVNESADKLPIKELSALMQIFLSKGWL